MMNNIGADRGTIPPSGTPGIYTTIMAEHPGGALIDGEGVNQPISWQGNYNSRDRHPHNAYSTSFIAIKGFIVGRGHALPSSNGSVLYMNHVDHVKIIDVGGYDQSINDNGAILNVQRSNYVLLEGDYVWGNGREGITTYICDHTIMRRNLVRIDSDNSVEPFGGIVNYANTYSRTQNSIVIDMDQYKDYSYRYLAGAFNDSVGGARYEPWSKMIDVQTVNCIALNVYNAFTVNVQQDNGSEPTILNNVIGWDIKTMGGMTTRLDTRSYAVITAPGSMQINQATFGKWRSPLARTAFNCFINGWEYTQSLLNSVIYDVQDYNGKAGNLFFGWETVDYNNICKTGKIDFNSTRSTHTITTNPIPACIRYLPRIEPGCPLWKAGKSGARVGANIMFMRGSSGTLWGEKGYDTEGTIPMWPFPHEELIKTKLSAYSHGNGKIIGARGFCAKTSIDGSLQTLTKYIWGYLGASLLPPFNIHVVPSGSSVVVSWDADSSNSNVSGYKIYLGKSPGIYTSSSIVAGKYTTAGTIRNLACGTYFFAVTTRSPHGESGPSYEVSKSVVNSR